MAARWYVVNVHAGFEKKVATSIEEKAIKKGLEDQFEQIIVPTETVEEVRRGKKLESERKLIPGYVLVRMQLSDETWHLVKNTANVTGFLGGGGRPQAISNAEAERIMNAAAEGAERARPAMNFEIGEQVRVIDGPFNTFIGLVEDVDNDKARLKVAVSIFGRSTPVELDYVQVEKI